MTSRIPMSVGLVAAVAVSLGMSQQAQAKEATPVSEADNVLNLSAEDIAQLQEMGVDTEAVTAELAEIEETYGPVDVRAMQRTVNTDMQENMGAEYTIDSRYMEDLRQRFESEDRANRHASRVILGNPDDGCLHVGGKGVEFHYEFDDR